MSAVRAIAVPLASAATPTASSDTTTTRRSASRGRGCKDAASSVGPRVGATGRPGVVDARSISCRFRGFLRFLLLQPTDFARLLALHPRGEGTPESHFAQEIGRYLIVLKLWSGDP